MIKALVIFFCFSTLSFAGWAPNGTEKFTLVEYNLRTIKKKEKYTYITDLQYKKDFEELSSHKLRFGFYKRITKNWKLGAFLANETGRRHDDDWIIDSGTWQWKDSSDRFENSLSLIVNYRNLLSRSLVYELRSEVNYNERMDQLSFKFRPGLIYHKLTEGKPKYSIFLRYEVYHPLNYGTESIYEQWLYFGSLFHTGKNWKFGAHVALSERIWTENDLITSTSSSWTYENKVTTTHIGLTLFYFY
jgi:hypothetical protein